MTDATKVKARETSSALSLQPAPVTRGYCTRACPGVDPNDGDACPNPDTGASGGPALHPGTVEACIKAVGVYVSSRDDLGRVHFVEISDALRALASPAPTKPGPR